MNVLDDELASNVAVVKVYVLQVAGEKQFTKSIK